MNLAQLRYACAVADARSFKQAATHCGVSQPTVSNNVADLEEELGGKLFSRTGRRIELTPFGEHLLDALRAALNSVDDIRRRADAFGADAEDRVRVGISHLFDAKLLERVFDSFRSEHRGVELVLEERSVSEMAARLDRHQLDVMLVVEPPVAAHRQQLPLYEEPLRYLPRGGPVGSPGPTTVSLEDVARDRLALTLDDCGLAPATRALFHRARVQAELWPSRAVSYQALEQWTTMGIAGALLPHSRISECPENYPVVTIAGDTVRLTFAAVWVRDRARTPAIATFIAHLRRFCQGLRVVATSTDAASSEATALRA